MQRRHLMKLGSMILSGVGFTCACVVVSLATSRAQAPDRPGKGLPYPGTGGGISIDNVDPRASDRERVRVLWGLIGQVVNDLDSTDRDNVRDNKKRFMLHVAWHEGQQITKREQNEGGPARSFYQMERAKAIDAVGHAVANSWVGRLATSAGGGTTERQILDARDQLNRDPSNPFFPANNLIEQKLRTVDLFGTYMARIAMKREPTPIPDTNQRHAEYWARFWKVRFDDDEDRTVQIATFKNGADAVDRLIP